MCREGSETNSIVDTLDSKSTATFSHVSQLYIIAAFFRVQEKDFWASGVRLQTQEETCHHSFHLSRERAQVFQLTDTLSPCAYIHNCAKEGKCGTSLRENKVVHNIDFGHAVHVIALGDKDGFPFRSA